MKQLSGFQSVKQLEKTKKTFRLKRFVVVLFTIFIVIMFLPWTQTVSLNGSVTAISPNNRPQAIQAVIGGKIEKWYVQEGQFVHRGDTIVFLSEIKSEYMDPNLINRTEMQMKSKENSANSYMSKVRSIDSQIDALIDGKKLKMQQAQNKIRQMKLKVLSDSMDFQANEKQLEIAIKQLERTQELKQQGLKSLTDLENKRLKVQEMEAKSVSLENKFYTTKNELMNALVDLNAIDADYRDKISKSESDKSSAMSSLFDVEATVTKLQNQVSSYEIRSGYYYVTAPQDGYISQALLSGVGETIKEGTSLVTIVPANSDHGVALFADPIDLPLLHTGEKIRLQFDGWPAIVFSGWPNVSYGTYGGEIVAIDNFISPNGKYRVLVRPDEKDHSWPKALRLGVGVKSMAMLNDVPIWYEIWRKINGFPSDFYVPEKTLSTTKKAKK
jgi:multidrug resistance efflux pump